MIEGVKFTAKQKTLKAVEAKKGAIAWDEEKATFMIAFLQGKGLAPCLPDDQRGAFCLEW